MQSQKTENYAKAYIKAPSHRPAPPAPTPTPSPKPPSAPPISQPAFTPPKSIMKTPERHHLRRFGIFMINFGLTSHLVLVFLLLIPKQVTNSCKTGAMLQSNTENQVAKMVFQK